MKYRTSIIRIDIESLRNNFGLSEAIRAGLDMLFPPPKMSVSEWAEANIFIPAGNAVPGPYRIANAPIQREPMDLLNDPTCQRVTLMWGAQIGKTMTALAVQGYCIAMTPKSQMMMQPSQGDLQTWLETKFEPMVESSPAINKVMSKARARSGVNNSRIKSYPGGFLMFAWAGSPKTMRGRSAPTIVADEVDGYVRTPEGHPVGLLWQRSASFDITGERFLFEISTPTVKGASYIEDAFLLGDQRHFYVKCHEPACGEFQVMHWENVSWPGRLSKNVDDHEKDKEGEHKPAEACYVCAHCGSTWNDGQRINAIRTAEAEGGGWRASKPFKGHASFHAWEAYSTFRKLGSIVRDYLDKLATDDVQTFVNVSLSRTFEVKGETADADVLKARRRDWGECVPDGVLYITIGADMQMDRLEYEIVGWGMGEETWSLGYGVLYGDPLAGEVFQDLEDVFTSTTFKRSNGVEMKAGAMTLDTGGTTGYPQAAWEWLRGKTGRRIFGVKGYAPSWGAPIVTAPQRRKSGKNARKADVWAVAVDEAKLVVMKRLNVENEGPGFAHFPADRGEEWFDQLTAEKLVTTYRENGTSAREWTKPDKARNEALDCRVYAYAALKIMNPRMKSLHEAFGAGERPAEEPAQMGPPAPVAETKPVPPPKVTPSGRRKWKPQ